MTIKENEIQIIRPFGPILAKVKIPKKIVDELNDYVDKTIKDEKKVSDLDHGKFLAGNVKQEFKLELDFMKKIGWDQFLGKGAANWIKLAIGKRITSVDIIESWIVRQFENEYNPTHWHGGHVSGVGYLKVPENLGPTAQKAKENINYNGHLQLIHGSRMFLSSSTITIKPEVGDFYFFPNYLMHVVYPFTNSNDERRSISFNANIDPKVYNVYQTYFE
tara:strand:- start:1225 stop:1881 length:657 start_codon:yes stop_codon:yes gene_type:complete